MSWHGIEGHDRIVEQFRRALQRGRLATTFLFAGPEGVGKRTFAIKFAQALLCSQRAEEALDPCEKCPACQQVAAGTHPDLDFVSKPPDKTQFPVSLLIGDEDHRMREGLCYRIGLKPFMGQRKVAVIDDADFLNDASANCLLKTLEEPPPRSVLILLTTSPAKQLPTIRSRCQLMRFLPLPEATVARLLVAQGIESETAARVARFSGGSVARGLAMAADDLLTFRQRLETMLALDRFDSRLLATEVASYVDEAGKEVQARRVRLRQVLEFALHYFRRQLRRATEGEPGPGRSPALNDADLPARCVERCLAAIEHTHRNAYQAAMIECWADDLAKIALGEPVG